MRTALYDRHCALGAKMVSFAGWDMPLQYKGIIAEHNCVRKAVGLFDVSHMGRINIEGEEAELFLEYLSTNSILGKPIGSATYSVWCHENGNSIDDVIIFKEALDRFFVIVNASNRQKDLSHVLFHAKNFKVKIQDCFSDNGILALQGPLAEVLLKSMIPDLPIIDSMHFIHSNNAIISRTGYTGAGGFEIYATNHDIQEWWDNLLIAGKQFGIEPVGLGARDTLRLEMGFALYGHELSDTIAPTESVSRWTVKWKKGSFLGRQSLEELEKSQHRRSAYGIILLDRAIAREGYPVFHEENEIGLVTSGTFSPTLQQAIAIVLVKQKLNEGEIVHVKVRDQVCRAQVVKIPFVKS